MSAPADWQAVERDIRDIWSDLDAIYECSTDSVERLEQIEGTIEQLVLHVVKDDETAP